MTRAKCAVSSRRRRKKILKRAKGFVGDRKNHIRLTKDAVMKALAFNYAHRKKKKGSFRRLWITRISIAAKINGISYSKLMNGLKKSDCDINRKLLSDLAIQDPKGFSFLVDRAKQVLV